MRGKSRKITPRILRGKLFLVGIGPGSIQDMTLRAQQAIKEAEIIIGYKTYIKLIKSLIQGKKVIATGMTEELSRARKAIELAFDGYKVALISSGDVGIYGMAGPIFELLKERGWKQGQEIEVEVIAGVTAASSCASLLGAPLMHDFCAISLSDILTPWETIVQRIESAAKADFVIVIYNPKSSRRSHQIIEAQKILLSHRLPETPVGIVTSCGRDHEKIVLTTLANMLNHKIGMSTTIIVGNSKTVAYEGFMITPRGYQMKKENKSPQRTLGKFYGIGVGPGDPKYLTLQARDIVWKVSYIFYPSSGLADESLALKTIESFVRKGVKIVGLLFPMTTDHAVLQSHWNLNARKIADVLNKGYDVAFITIGDPTFYSTWIYIVRTLRNLLPHAWIKTIPGVSSFSAAASILNMALGEGEERVAIIPVNRELSNVRDALENFDTVILLKTGSKLNRLIGLLEEMNLIDHVIMCTNIGTEKELIEMDLGKYRNRTAGYMTLIVVKKKEQLCLR